MLEPNDSEMLVAVLARQAKNNSGEHPDAELLLAYHSESLSPDAEQSIRDHLISCRSCTQSLLDLGALQLAGSEPPSEVANLTARASWRNFKTEIDDADQAAAPPLPAPGNQRQPFRLIAASFLVGVLPMSFWVAQLRSGVTALRYTVAELSETQVNPIVAYLDQTTRGDGDDVEIKIPAGQYSFQVVAFPESATEFRAFEAVLSDWQDPEQVIWRSSDDLELSEAETLRFIFTRAKVPSGFYRMQIHGVDGNHRQRVSDTVLKVHYQDS